MNRIDDAIRILEKRLDFWEDKKEIRCAEFTYRYQVYLLSSDNGPRSAERNQKEAGLVQMMRAQLGRDFSGAPLDRVMETVMQTAMPVLREIEGLRRKMCSVLKEDSELLHISRKKGLSEIKALSSKLNMYGTEKRKCVYATSDETAKALYAARVTAGGMEVDRKKCIFMSDPFSGYHEGNYILKRRAYAYVLDPKDFMPVIDFTIDKAGKCHIHFEGEWMSEKESVVPEACFEVDSVKERSFGGIELLYEDAVGSIYPVLNCRRAF